MKLKLTDDGSIIRLDDGMILHFSPSRFRTDIVEGDGCFLCGKNRQSVKFNDEHVIPEWILREFLLHDKYVSLPNGVRLRYDMYKVPCCAECNSFLGAHVEQPVSEILKGGHEAMENFVSNQTPWLLFKWLALIYLKTHLKDCTLRYSLDSRVSTMPIGALYDWELMHHIHSVIRTLRTGVNIDTRAIGSMFFFPTKESEHFEKFDYGDLIATKSLFLKFRGTAVVCVLNDACGCVTLMKDGPLSKIAGPISPIQLREIFVRVSYMNILLKPRPNFFTSAGAGMPKIGAQLPEFFESDQGTDEEYGALLWQACHNLLNSYSGDNKDEVIKNIKTGHWTFLFDSDGNFDYNSMDLPLPDRAQPRH